MRRPFAVIGFSFFLALWVFGKLGEPVAAISAIVAFVMLVVSVSVRKLRRETMLLCILLSVLSAGAAFITATETVTKPILRMNGEKVRIVAHKIDFPYEENGTVRYSLRTDTVNDRPVHTEIVLYSKMPTSESDSDLFFVTGNFEIQRVPFSTNIYCKVTDYKDIRVVSHAPTFTSRMIAVRRYIRDLCLKSFPGSSTGSVLYALLTGDRQYIPKDVYSRMQRSGIVHIFAVSGFHLSVFSMAILYLLERRKTPAVLRLFLPMLPILFFCGITGFSKSCLRAGIMLTLLLLGRALMRGADALNSLGLSALLICFARPLEACDLSLVLSMLGCLSVILTAPIAEKITRHIRFKPRFLRKIVRASVMTMLVSVGVGLFILPVSVLELRSFSVLAPVANALIMWAAEWSMILTGISVLLSLWSPLTFLFKPSLLISGIFAKYCVRISEFLGGLWISSVQPPWTLSCFLVAVSLLWLSFAILFPLERRKKMIYTASVLVSMVIVAVSLTAIGRIGGSVLTIADIGQNAAVLLQSKGESVLIGCGNENPQTFVRTYTNKLDYLLIPDTSSFVTDGAGELVRNLSIGKITVPERVPNTEPLFFFAKPQIQKELQTAVGRTQMEYIATGEASAVRLQMNGKTMLLLFTPGANLSSIPQEWLSSDILYCRGGVPLKLDMEKYALVLLSCEVQRGMEIRRCYPSAHILCTDGTGDLRILIDRDGKIRLKEGA